jgi:hypothetical protein
MEGKNRIIRFILFCFLKICVCLFYKKKEKMQHMLLKHAQLTKRFQLDIKIRERGFLIHDKRYSYLPVANQIAVFPPGSDEWRGFTSFASILNSVKWKDEDISIYTFEIQTIQPDNVEAFAFEDWDGLCSPREYLRNVLKQYLLYAIIEYEK